MKKRKKEIKHIAMVSKSFIDHSNKFVINLKNITFE